MSRQLGGIAFAVALAFASPARADGINERAEKLNDAGKEAFARGDIEDAVGKVRAAIAMSPQARYYFNLCFLLNAGGELEAALGACQQIDAAEGADADLRLRASDLIETIKKKRGKDGDRPSKPSPYPDKGTPDKPVVKEKPSGEPPAVDPNAPPPITRLPDGRAAYPPSVVRPMRAPGKALPHRRFHIGVLAGISSSTVADDLGELGSRAGIAIGAYAASTFSRLLAAQVEVAYVQRGGSGFDVDDINLNYVTIPVLAKFLMPAGRVARFHLESGLALSILTSSSSDDASSTDVAVLFGGGLTLHAQGRSAWVIDLRYERGLIDVTDVLGGSNRATTLFVSYAF